jgi:hypothetical protein
MVSRNLEPAVRAALLKALDLAACGHLREKWLRTLGLTRQLTPEDILETRRRLGSCQHIGDILEQQRATQIMRQVVFQDINRSGVVICPEEFSELTGVRPMWAALYGAVGVSVDESLLLQ